MQVHRLVPPPAALLIAIVLLWLVVRLPPEWAMWSGTFDFPGRRLLAMGLFGVGVALMMAALAVMQRAKTTVNPLSPEQSTELVRHGVFGWSRNPIYLGDAVVLAGAGFWFGTFWAVVAVVAFVVYIQNVQIRVEERALAARFGPAFEAYRARVRRWI